MGRVAREFKGATSLKSAFGFLGRDRGVDVAYEKVNKKAWG
jgi:hypothetical protein